LAFKCCKCPVSKVKRCHGRDFVAETLYFWALNFRGARSHVLHFSNICRALQLRKITQLLLKLRASQCLVCVLVCWPGPDPPSPGENRNGGEQLRVILMEISIRAHNGDKRRLKDGRTLSPAALNVM